MNEQDPFRSMRRIRTQDLQKLGELALQDLESLFTRRKETGELYRDRLLGIVLAQGAALHYIDETTGVKDFDVWSFFRAHPLRPFPYRRNNKVDFKDSRFGLSPDSPSHFTGTRIDLLGRSIVCQPEEDPFDVIQNYLRDANTSTARFLANKAMVVLWPAEKLGKILWPI